jgi:hypothetical protein
LVVKWPDREAHHLPASSAEIKNVGAIRPRGIYWTAQRHTSENSNPNIHHREDIKYDKTMVIRKARSMR